MYFSKLNYDPDEEGRKQKETEGDVRRGMHVVFYIYNSIVSTI